MSCNVMSRLLALALFIAGCTSSQQGGTNPNLSPSNCPNESNGAGGSGGAAGSGGSPPVCSTSAVACLAASSSGPPCTLDAAKTQACQQAGTILEGKKYTYIKIFTPTAIFVFAYDKAGAFAGNLQWNTEFGTCFTGCTGLAGFDPSEALSLFPGAAGSSVQNCPSA